MKCLECGTEFCGSRSSQVFCCEAHRRRYWHRVQRREREALRSSPEERVAAGIGVDIIPEREMQVLPRRRLRA